MNKHNGLSAERSPLPEIHLPPHLDALVALASERVLKPTQLASAVGGDLDAIEAVGRMLAIEEGRLLEAAAISLARTSTGNEVLVGMKLPVLKIAADIAKRNKLESYHRLSLDLESQSHSSYYPDLVLVDRTERSAIIIDVKRSLAGYSGSGSLLKLQKRMEAAAWVLPEILWRHHQRLAVETVGIAIIDGSKTTSDIDDGIWSLDRLDDLLGVPGAGSAAQSCILAFREALKTRWEAALPSSATNGPLASPPDEAPSLPSAEKQIPRKRGRPRKHQPPAAITVGFYRPGGRIH
ncbi:hypothetical protein [Pseudorhizobium flavum]|uniref:hypothetical protein n=1 Tax=Pseudorhizobium flavum TaxID=1335061 RepID=UPI00376FB23B